MVFCSGQIPLVPETGEMVDGGIREQTVQVMENLKQVLGAAGADFDTVTRTTIFLADMADFGAVNEIYATYFGPVAPARATVQVAALPKGARVEIDAIACL
jgi:2-iminobutanoate/2-iminopropanoate deaminase